MLTETKIRNAKPRETPIQDRRRGGPDSSGQAQRIETVALPIPLPRPREHAVGRHVSDTSHWHSRVIVATQRASCSHAVSIRAPND